MERVAGHRLAGRAVLRQEETAQIEVVNLGRAAERGGLGPDADVRDPAVNLVHSAPGSDPGVRPAGKGPQTRTLRMGARHGGPPRPRGSRRRVLGGVSRGVQVVDPDLENDQRRLQTPESPAADAVAQVLGAVAAETEGDGRQLTELEVTRPVSRQPLGDGVAEEDDLGLLVE